MQKRSRVAATSFIWLTEPGVDSTLSQNIVCTESTVISAGIGRAFGSLLFDIVDLAKAYVCVVTRMIDGEMKQSYEIFNIGTGCPVSVLELVTAFEKVNNLKLNYKFAPRRSGDVTAIWADPTLANKELGWKAGRSV